MQLAWRPGEGARGTTTNMEVDFTSYLERKVVLPKAMPSHHVGEKLRGIPGPCLSLSFVGRDEHARTSTMRTRPPASMSSFRPRSRMEQHCRPPDWAMRITKPCRPCTVRVKELLGHAEEPPFCSQGLVFKKGAQMQCLTMDHGHQKPC